ncbi:MAG: hypothetical protein J6X27_00485 [Bacteroidaceae bacterium]|nr:hypothetical protein [Bacteroidaceae bacterium]
MTPVVFDYQYNFNSPCVSCTRELFMNACQSANVARRIKKFREEGDEKAKRGLPAVCWQAHFPDSHRSNESAVFSGLFQLDIDHVEAPRELFDSWTATKDFDELGIYLVFVTPSGHGLKVVAQMRPRAGVPNIISAHQRWLSEQLGLTEFDACTKDLARMAFVPLAEDILYENPELWELQQIITNLDTPPHCGLRAAIPEIAGQARDEEGGESKNISNYDNNVTVKGNFTINGHPMVDYVLGWFAANGGYPQQGQRNNTIYRCALYFRNFTDFSPKVLAENIPSFGLSDAEMLQVCTSACGAARTKYWPRDIAGLLDEEEAEQEGEEVQEIDDTPPAMPPLIDFFVDHADRRFKAACVLAMLPVLGGLATDVRATFPDGQEHSLSFMSVICAKQASGKSFARTIFDTMMQRLTEEDDISWEQIRLWNDTVKANKKDFKKIEGAERMPEVVIRRGTSTFSEAFFFTQLRGNKGKHIIGFYEEIDTLAKEVKGGASCDMRDIFREAFDNALHGRGVVSPESFSGMQNIYFNFLALGTPNSVMKFYNNPEDGLVSRTIFYQLPVGVFDSLPEHKKITPAKKQIVRQLADYLIDIKKHQAPLVDEKGHVQIETEEYIDPIWREWRQMAELRAIKNGREAEGIFLKRASVIAWRASIIYWLLWELQTDAETLRKLKDAFFWTADIVLREQLAMFGEALDRLQTPRKVYQPKNLFDRLPVVFTTRDVITLCGFGTNPNTIRSKIHYWKHSGLIRKSGKTFVKLA